MYERVTAQHREVEYHNKENYGIFDLTVVTKESTYLNESKVTGNALSLLINRVNTCRKENILANKLSHDNVYLDTVICLTPTIEYRDVVTDLPEPERFNYNVYYLVFKTDTISYVMEYIEKTKFVNYIPVSTISAFHGPYHFIEISPASLPQYYNDPKSIIPLKTDSIYTDLSAYFNNSIKPRLKYKRYESILVENNRKNNLLKSPMFNKGASFDEIHYVYNIQNVESEDLGFGFISPQFIDLVNGSALAITHARSRCDSEIKMYLVKPI